MIVSPFRHLFEKLLLPVLKGGGTALQALCLTKTVLSLLLSCARDGFNHLINDVMKYLMSHFCSVECDVFANMLRFRVTNYPSYNLMSVIDVAICIPRKEWLWQQFLSRFANFFAKLFLLFECLAD